MSYLYILLSNQDRLAIAAIAIEKLALAAKASPRIKLLAINIEKWTKENYLKQGGSIRLTKDQGMREISTDFDYGYILFDSAWDTYFHLQAMPYTILNINEHLLPCGKSYGVSRELVEKGIQEATDKGYIAMLPRMQTSKIWCKIVPDDFVQYRIEKRNLSLARSHLNNDIGNIMLGSEASKSSYDSLTEFRSLYRQLGYTKES